MASAEAYRELIERLEIEARESPGRYKAKVALFAALGFLVLGGALLLSLGLSVGLVIGLVLISPWLLLKLAKLIWIPIAFGWLMLRALWVKFPPPEGYRLADGEAPVLCAEIERLREAAGAPRLDGIYIDSDLNAAAATVPRLLGLFGHRHYLLLGLPLMQLLDREQFAGVVAHEFGHFGGGHGRFSGWIYHVRLSWYRLLEALTAQRSWTSRLFVRFFNWYAPYFNAYSFVMARGNEYQADAVAARITSPQTIGHALIRTNLGSERLSQDFWPGVRHALKSQPQPPALLFREMASNLRQPAAEDELRLQRALGQKPDFDDTHPTLAQRLAALGVDAGAVAPPTVSAAEALLGDLLPKLEQRFSEEWRGSVESAWQEQHQQAQADAERLAVLQGQTLHTPEEAVELARLTEDLHPDADVLPLYQDAVARAPESAVAHFRLGALLLDREDASGVAHLRKAMELDAEATEMALHQLGQYYYTVGDEDGRLGVIAELETLYTRRNLAAHERAAISARDRFEAHGLSEEELRKARAVFERVGKIRRAWIVRKLIDDPEGPPHFAVLVEWQWLKWMTNEQAMLDRVAEGLELPGSLVVFSPGSQRATVKRVRQSGAPVYGA